MWRKGEHSRAPVIKVHGELALRRGDNHGDDDEIGQRALTWPRTRLRRARASRAVQGASMRVSYILAAGWRRSCATATLLAAMAEAWCFASGELARRGGAEEASKRAIGSVASSWQQWPD